VVTCVVQFLSDHDITYCPEHVFYDVRVSNTLLNNSVSVSHILAVKLINVAVWHGNLNKQYCHDVGETICPSAPYRWLFWCFTRISDTEDHTYGLHLIVTMAVCCLVFSILMT